MPLILLQSLFCFTTKFIIMIYDHCKYNNSYKRMTSPITVKEMAGNKHTLSKRFSLNHAMVLLLQIVAMHEP